ncbi:MAG TPA: hypothetical protein VF406_15950 [Thermodesulfobacteriota bacterium]
MRRTILTLAAAVLIAGCATDPESSAARVPDTQLQRYVEARRQLASQGPEMARAAESTDLTGQRRDTIEAALDDSPMSYEEFLQIHWHVLADPALSSYVEARLRGSASGSPR